MHEAHRLNWKWCLFVTVAVLVAASVIGPSHLQAQGCPTVSANTGDKGVYNSNGCLTNSHVYIDASAFVGTSSTDFCTVLNTALSKIPSGSTALVDARGLYSGSFSNLTTTCPSSNDSTTANPWYNISTGSIVLLPAGIIQIPETWILPSGTKLIGQGGEDPGTGSGVTRTTIQAQSGFATGTNGAPMLKMGTGVGCTGTSIEDLVLDGNKVSNLNGIDNGYCTDQSYVKRVTIYQVLDNGLNVYDGNDPLGNNAAMSGPYSDIIFDTGAGTVSTTTIGAYLNYATHGIHGMTCTTGSTTVTEAGTCIQVAASGNSVQDVRVEGLMTGVSVTASNVVVVNVDGDTNPRTSTSTIDVVVIGAVQNVVVMGISNNCVSNCTDKNDATIKDNATSTNLTVATDPYVGLYVVGAKLASVSSTSFSRYSTSPSAATWISGNQSVSGTPCTNTVNSVVYGLGSLYSNTSNGNLYVCSVTNGEWESVP